jgi:uncharacterized protein YjbI with pentapeptide repeats
MARKRNVGSAIGNPEPTLPIEELVRLASVDLEQDGALSGVLLEDAQLAGIEASALRLAEVGLRRVDLSSTRLRGVHMLEVSASAVNGANAVWPYAQMSRVTFTSSTLVGLDLSNGQLARTTFSECKLDLANLRMSSIRDVVFVGCSLRSVDFYAATLSSVRFESCDLHEADFSQATLETVDLRTSTITDVRGVGSLKGATVDSAQLLDLAPSLASELGIHVEDRGEQA